MSGTFSPCEIEWAWRIFFAIVHDCMCMLAGTGVSYLCSHAWMNVYSVIDMDPEIGRAHV